MSAQREFIQEQNDLRDDYKIRKRTSPIVNVWRSRSTRGILFLFCFSIVVPVLVYYFLIDNVTTSDELYDTCAVDETYRVPCGKPENTTIDKCNKIHCCFDNTTKRCFHYLPSKYYYFSDSENQDYGSSLVQSPFFEAQLKTVYLSINPTSDKSVQIMLHDNSTTGTITCTNTTEYNCTINSNPLFVEFYRPNSRELLLTTAKGPMIISDHYWEWSFQLTDEYLFGLGQTLIDLSGKSTLTKVIYGNDKDHNTLPNFLAYKNGKYHGLIVRHSGPLEITVFASKLVSLKSLSGKKITLELSVGPTIQEVINQFNDNKAANLIVTPDIFGVHVCREGSSLILKDILEDFKKEQNLDFRYTSDCLHENLFLAAINEKSDSSVTSEMRDLIGDKIIKSSHRFSLSILPQVPYDSDLYTNTADLNIYFKLNQTDYKGQYFKNDVVYPYFNHASVDTFIQKLLEAAKQRFDPHLPTDFVLSRNWPSDQSFVMKEIDKFKYLSKELTEAMSSTLPWNASSDDELQFLEHNNYGYFHVEKIGPALGDGAFIMTASHTFDNFQPIINQNVDISWTNFHNTIVTILSNSLFGHPLTSIPVCGSTSTFTSSHESLCIRWYLMASTAPIFRISSDEPRRDPTSLASLTSKYAASQAKSAIDFRYSLMYYFNTVLGNNEPLMRPMFYDFPDDNNTFALVDQYMVGSDLLVVHPTLPDQTQVTIYLPPGDKWFEFWGGDSYDYNLGKDGWISLTVSETDWIGFVREGSIIPIILNTDENVKQVRLKIALCDNENCEAKGMLITGDEQSFNFTSTQSELAVTNQNGNDSFVLHEIEIFRPHSTCLIKLNADLKLVEDPTVNYHNQSNSSC